MSVSQSTRRRVLARDEGQCRFVLSPGERCHARLHLTLHHIVPLRNGGSDADGNLVVLCGPHHLLIERADEERARQEESWGIGRHRFAHSLRAPARRFLHKKGCTPSNCVTSCEVGWR